MGFDEKKPEKCQKQKKIRCGYRITPQMGTSWGLFAYNKDHQFKYF